MLTQVAEQLVGQDVEVCIVSIRSSPDAGTIVLSENMASWKRLTRPGTIVWGKVNKVTPLPSRCNAMNSISMPAQQHGFRFS